MRRLVPAIGRAAATFSQRYNSTLGIGIVPNRYGYGNTRQSQSPIHAQLCSLFHAHRQETPTGVSPNQQIFLVSPFLLHIFQDSNLPSRCIWLRLLTAFPIARTPQPRTNQCSSAAGPWQKAVASFSSLLMALNLGFLFWRFRSPQAPIFFFAQHRRRLNLTPRGACVWSFSSRANI